jgi:acyl dehydratase
MDSKRVALQEVHGPITAFIDPDEIVAFALATNDDNPRYLAGTAVPPTYPVVPGYQLFMGIPPLAPSAVEGNHGGVHGIHDLRLHKAVSPGTHLHTTAERVSVITSKAGMNVILLLRSFDDADELVVEQFWSVMYLGAVTGGDHGQPAPDHKFPEEARDKLVGRTTLSTSRDQTFRYAGASGDRAAIHVNDEAAQRMGFPRKFNQGLCTLGIVARGLVEIAADRNPNRVRRLAVRFASPMFPGDDIELAVYDLGSTRHNLHAYAFEAHSNGKAVLQHGRFEVGAA